LLQSLPRAPVSQKGRAQRKRAKSSRTRSAEQSKSPASRRRLKNGSGSTGLRHGRVVPSLHGIFPGWNARPPQH